MAEFDAAKEVMALDAMLYAYQDALGKTGSRLVSEKLMDAIKDEFCSWSPDQRAQIGDAADKHSEYARPVRNAGNEVIGFTFLGYEYAPTKCEPTAER